MFHRLHWKFSKSFNKYYSKDQESGDKHPLLFYLPVEDCDTISQQAGFPLGPGALVKRSWLKYGLKAFNDTV
jgi:hypothetical protein